MTSTTGLSPLDDIKKVQGGTGANEDLLKFGFTASSDFSNETFAGAGFDGSDDIFTAVKGFLRNLLASQSSQNSADLLEEITFSILKQFSIIVGEPPKDIEWQNLVTLSALIFNASENVKLRKFFEASATALVASVIAMLLERQVYVKLTNASNTPFKTEPQKQDAIEDDIIYRLYTYLRVFALRSAIVGLNNENVDTSQKFSRFLKSVYLNFFDDYGCPGRRKAPGKPSLTESKFKRKLLEKLASAFDVSIGDTTLPGMVFGTEHPFRDLVVSTTPMLMMANVPKSADEQVTLRPISLDLKRRLKEIKWRGIKLYNLATEPALASLRLDGIVVVDDVSQYRFYFKDRRLHYEKCGYSGGILIPVNA